MAIQDTPTHPQYPEEDTRPAPSPRKKSAVNLPLGIVAALAITVFLLLVLSGYWVFRTARDLVVSNQITGLGAFSLVMPDGASPNTTSTGGETDGFSLADPSITQTQNPSAQGDNGASSSQSGGTNDNLLSPSTFQPWEGTERVNILFMGIDSRCDEEGPVRTDSMMLISINPVRNRASILSIPRDIWVEIPGVGMDSINQANYWGEAYRLPGGGPALAADTVSNFLGIEVEHYLTVNFEAFRDFVNLIDGIQIDVPAAIDDPTYPDECYGYDPFFVEKGLQSMNGPIALKYARTRATIGGDIDRAGRQQEVILAIRQKVLDVNMIPTLIARSPQLWSSFQENVSTSLTEREIIQLALLMPDIHRDRIKSGVIDFNYVYNEVAPNGRQVLVPRYDKIHALREELFRPVTAPPERVDNLFQLVQDENAKVAIWNGTQTFGLAGGTERYLVDQYISVSEIGNADAATYSATQIIDYGGDHPNTVLYLKQLMSIPPLNSTQGEPNGQFDILIILGADWELPEEYQ